MVEQVQMPTDEIAQYMMEPGELVSAVPSMMSKPERAFLYGYAAKGYRGDGIIVDAGIFLGGSTICFGCGLEMNPQRVDIVRRWPRPIQSFERAITGPQLARARGMAGRTLPQEGESFAHLIEAFIRPVAHLVDLHIGDILQLPTGSEPIEILFLDVLKSTRIASHTVERFFGRLIAGRSIVIQQDYFIEALPYIKTMQEYFGDHFSFMGELASSAVFRCDKAIGQDRIAAFLARRPNGEEEIAWATQAMQRTSVPHRRLMMAVSRLRVIMHYKGREAAEAELKDIESMYAGLGQPDRERARTQRSMKAARAIVAGTAATGVGTALPDR